MASDRGKQQAYCKVCSKQFSVSHGGIDVRRHGEGKQHLELFNGFFKKNHGFSARYPPFFFRNLTCLQYVSVLKSPNFEAVWFTEHVNVFCLL